MLVKTAGVMFTASRGSGPHHFLTESQQAGADQSRRFASASALHRSVDMVTEDHERLRLAVFGKRRMRRAGCAAVSVRAKRWSTLAINKYGFERNPRRVKATLKCASLMNAEGMCRFSIEGSVSNFVFKAYDAPQEKICLAKPRPHR